MKYNGQSLISIDWLSVYVETAFKQTPTIGTVKAMEYGTQVYQFTEYYQIDGKDVAVLTYEPRSHALKAHTGIIKVLNEYLYTENPYTLICNIMNDWGLQPLSVSRLDICADFHSFVDYPNMANFFADFLSLRIWRIGKGKFKVIGKECRRLQDDSFVVQGVQSSTHTYQYLRFGGNTSDVAVYLYNKSQEFKDVKTKNYIAAMWEKNGMDMDRDVWRLEFSLKGNGIKIIDDATGEVYTDKLQIIKDVKLLHRLYYSLYARYWDFRVNDGQVRKDRMKRCNLLKLNDIPLKLTKFSLCPDSTIGDKRLLSAMERVYNELRGKCKQDSEVVRHAMSNVADYKGLTAWAMKKGLSVGVNG